LPPIKWVSSLNEHDHSFALYCVNLQTAYHFDSQPKTGQFRYNLIMKNKTKSGLRPPQLPRPMPTREVINLENSAEYAACQIVGSDFSKQTASGLLFDQVSLQRTIFQQSRLDRLRLFDVRASASDFSGAGWEKARLRQVEFSDCRLIGIQLLEAQLEHVRFKECNLEGAIFASAVFKNARFENCNLRGVFFEQADLNGVVFRDCDLAQANLSGAKLQDADFRGSILNGMRVGADGFRGAVIDSSQAVQVVGLLGVVIRELETPRE
jgi:uncharacterized protein YjbI with pentapeptide repeats